MRAVFLDRDGTINREVDYLRSIRQLRILPGAASSIKELNQLGFLVIIISNQPVVARGWLTEQGVDEIHIELLRRLTKKGAKINAIYYCPHHPSGRLKKYRTACDCRKPNTGLLKKAVRDFEIDLGKSFFIGDRTGDILAGQRVGTKTILVQTGYGGTDNLHNVKPDAIAKNLEEATSIIMRQFKNT